MLLLEESAERSDDKDNASGRKKLEAVRNFEKILGSLQSSLAHKNLNEAITFMEKK